MKLDIAVLLTCHNRREKTLSCLQALFACTLPIDTKLHVVLVDDGSTDNTGEAVKREYPQVEVLEGDGNLFWNRGMHLAFGHALMEDYDAYIWLNDDTVLHPSAIETLCSVNETLQDQFSNGVVVVGSTQSSITETRTYGGFMWRTGPFTKPVLIEPGRKPILCDAMNGNIVYIPRVVASKVGNIDPVYRHAMGDIDYSLRTVKKGVRLFVAPGYLGTCENNSLKGTYFDKSLSRMERWRKIRAPTGLPPLSWLVFTKRHYGKLWPIYWAWPYIKIWF